MIYKHAQDHPKVDYTKLSPLDDLQARSGSSKSGLYKTSTLGRFTSMLRIIQSGLYKLPPLDDLQARSESSKSGLYKTSNFEWLHFHPKLDHTKHPISEDA